MQRNDRHRLRETSADEVEGKSEGESIDSYFTQIDSSEFEDTVLDSGLAIIAVSLVYFFTFQFGMKDEVLSITTALVFLPAHCINHAFHYQKSIKKAAYRPYFFAMLATISVLQSSFYIMKLGLDSGFLMVLLAAIVYPSNMVKYSKETFQLIGAAMGIFTGGSLCLHTYVSTTFGAAEDVLAEVTLKHDVSPANTVLLNAVNFTLAFALMMLVVQSHRQTYESLEATRRALKIK